MTPFAHRAQPLTHHILTQRSYMERLPPPGQARLQTRRRQPQERIR